MSFKDFCGIHFANGYDKNAAANELFARVGNEVGGATWADVTKAPSFADYCDAIELLDA